MVFEAIGIIFGNINIFGTGMFILVLGLIFALARGITKDKQDMLLYTIIFGMFGTILIFKESFLQNSLFVTISIMIIIWGWNYLDKSGGDQNY
jgi:ABC-type uncharacterized transport system permease subunit